MCIFIYAQTHKCNKIFPQVSKQDNCKPFPCIFILKMNKYEFINSRQLILQYLRINIFTIANFYVHISAFWVFG